ncbi:iron-containing alcohol dehydrogenase [Ponticaulis sp.]|uniref:iron-containing alcohol dehydrogenase n=1 Tax=Ponticaulis sp. TaxID=2020902 RepID=UPI000B6EEFE6|nr:iron-containing alcohol dehydrogenase [Ponticaulis sp.]MAJ07787.1 4-hydroxybutyrate dehydrogenase [Ponticaulis sp.]RPG18108.1 MAG: iron-containing alcohol dehydrogenase [Hyphomonadaceae bacterium TMED125]|tara:strand:- start:37566 stop:38693 length:1128 start_codon:yes stop_codon:yes gene_type:complete
MPVINFVTPCILDHGAITKLGKTMAGLNITKGFVVTDPGIKQVGLLDKVTENISGAHEVFAGTEPNPTEKQVTEVTAMYKESGCDGIIALGGGSSMDLAKAVGLMASHGGNLADYGATVGGSKKIGKIPPLIAIPTTAGTGSEVSVGMIIIQNDGHKQTYASPHLVPATAICDPDLTLGLPPLLTAATGMDAVTHCIEAILTPTVNPPAEGIGYEGLGRAVGDGWLKRAVQDGSDADARWNMMVASFEGALAFVKGLGGVHAMSHAAGRLHDLKLHHGTLNAIFLPHFMRFHADADERKFQRIRQMMNLKEGACVGDAIAKLNEDIGIPAKLSDIGVTADHGPSIVEYALKDLAHYGNAKPVTQADYEKIFELAL